MPGHGRGVVVQEREKVTCQMQGAGVELVGGGIIERGLSLVELAERQFELSEVLVADHTDGGKRDALFEFRQGLVVLA
jgi:hypothetical protein